MVLNVQLCSLVGCRKVHARWQPVWQLHSEREGHLTRARRTVGEILQWVDQADNVNLTKVLHHISSFFVDTMLLPKFSLFRAIKTNCEILSLEALLLEVEMNSALDYLASLE